MLKRLRDALGRIGLARPDAPFAAGANALGGSTRFAVRAPDASGVTLCLFNSDAEHRVAMTRAGEQWQVEVAGVGPGQRYGYRTAADPSKLLVDPYAVQLDRAFAYDPRLSAPGQDTAALVPKAVVPAPRTDAPPPPPLFTPGGLIYELNVRGFTMRHPDVPEAQRGTVAALAHPAIVAHLQRIGVAAVELMPVVAWVDERHLPPLGLRNAWGYNPVTMMALDPRLAPGGVEELRATVTTLRTAGIGVILDVVLNHTGEGDADGPKLSLRGLSPDSYAREADGSLANHAGTGNTLDFGRPHVRHLALDALRHFAALGIDGFRFDLAPVLDRPDFDGGFFREIAANPILSTRVMIAEPWDIGPDGYRLGRFPGNWLEWNDRFRDDARRFWRGNGSAGALATRIAGSSDVFGERPTRSVNFVAAHDGFTLADTVRYAERRNEANGEGNRDGHSGEVSWVSGTRDTDVRALLATLFAARGTPMLTAGDEFGRTQDGNNNAYCQDELGWLDWEGRDHDLEAFVAALSAFRRTGALTDQAWLRQADWRDLAERPMTPGHWADADGFVLRLPDADQVITIRVDRAARRTTLMRGTLIESVSARA